MKQILIVEDDSFLNKMLDYNLTADYTEVETMPKLSFKYREYQGFLLKISA